MNTQFRPVGKQRFRHYFKRPTMDAADEWDIQFSSISSCFEESEAREFPYDYLDKFHMR